MRTTTLLMVLLSPTITAADFQLVRDEAGGTATLLEDGYPVLVYNQGDQLAKGVSPDRTRSCYVHPLYGLDGEVLTDDFPRDHLHHRGLSMMWPGMKVGDRPVDHWHIDGIRTLNRELDLVSDGAPVDLVALNEWVLDDGTVAAEERMIYTVHPAGELGRIIDVTATITAGSEPVTLQGAKPPKGYGGHMIRFAPRTGEIITTDHGVLKGDSDRLPFRWADYSARFEGAEAVSGIAMFPHPTYPDYAPGWQLRHYGIISIAWPGLAPHVLQPGTSIELAGRLWIHRGNVDSGKVSSAWNDWMQEPEIDRNSPIARRIKLLADPSIDWTPVGTATYDISEEEVHGYGNEPRNSFLVGPAVADFELELEFLPAPESNSGIQIRSHVTEAEDAVRGYQIELDTSDRAWTGGLYDELRRGWLEPLDSDPVARGAFMPGQWNHLRIIAEGPHLRTWVNGIPCVDAYDATDLEGLLALQVHGGSCDIRFKNMYLTPLGRHDWIHIWDGRTLDGWRPSGGGTWSIEDGVLVGRQQADDPSHGHLVWHQTVTDFTLRLQFMSPSGNSGVYFRVAEGGHAGVQGFQAEVDGRSGRTGGLYETAGRQWVIPTQDATDAFEDMYNPGEWNTMTITARGPRTVVHVNGKKTADLVDPKGRQKGMLALQLHGNQDMEIRFRSIEMLEPITGTVRADGTILAK